MTRPSVRRTAVQPTPLTGGDVVRAGLSGAAIAGVWTGIYETMRVRNGEIDSQEAIRTTMSSTAIGAGAGAVATIVGHVARGMPVLALAGAAAGLIYLANQSAGASSAPKERSAADPDDDAAKT
ncbi:MAG: hypothetical protein AAGI51_00225 [Pseudomonadota bacterium]